jgi:hypothetical protein
MTQTLMEHVKKQLRKFPIIFNVMRSLHDALTWCTVNLRRILPYRLRYGKMLGLNQDPGIEEILTALKGEITSCVETGSFRGYTSVFFARIFQNIKGYSIELKDEYVNESTWRVRKYPNYQIIQNSSPTGIKNLIEENVLGSSPFFFLDAHWFDFCPTKDELLEVSKLKKAIIIIHDFEMPGKPDIYRPKGFPEGIGFQFLKNIGIPYKVLSPNYNPPDGYVLLFQGFSKEEYLRILAIPTIHSLFNLVSN